MTIRIASGTTDQYVYFNAGVTGLSSFTVYRSRNGAAAAAMTTPTINETDSTNMPGVYELLLDEDMTIGASNVTEAMAFYITAAGMTPKYVEIELFDPATIGPASDVAAIKAKTDQMNFGATNAVDANITNVAGGSDITAAGTGNQAYGES